VKTLRGQKLRILILTHRKLLQSKAIAIDNDLRATLRNFVLKVGVVGRMKFEARIKKLVENLPDLAVLAMGLLAREAVRAGLRYWWPQCHVRQLPPSLEKGRRHVQQVAACVRCSFSIQDMRHPPAVKAIFQPVDPPARIVSASWLKLKGSGKRQRDDGRVKRLRVEEIGGEHLGGG
jgi:hypothetical protein